jgi:hypothetical protein
VLRLPPGRRRAAWEKALSGTWLEMQWGWKPLISDTKEIAQTIARLIQEPPHKERLVYRASQEIERMETNVMSGLPGYLIGQFTRVEKQEYSCQYIVGMSSVRKAHASGVQRLIDVCGFNPEDFIPTLYEVAPWSWLVDYITNIGDIVEAAATSLSDVKWIVKTTRQKQLETQSTKQLKSLPEFYSSYFKFVSDTSSSGGSFGSYTSIRTLVNRTIPLTLGVPQFRFSHPGESATKMLNVLSVLAQRRKGLQDIKNIPPYAKKERRFNMDYAHL